MSMKHCAQLFQKLSLNNFLRTTILAKPTIASSLHTTSPRCDLNEFFEPPENWGKDEIRSGRPWKVSELRLKSNEDLHKLWFILLKEKNMLLTMEHYFKENYELFPSPERIDKVEESMQNLETAVRERNKAYFELETGETGERPGRVIYDPVGMKHWRKLTQHYTPKAYNSAWKRRNPLDFDNDEVEEFFKLLKERNIKRKHGLRRPDRSYVRGLLRRFPKLDLQYIQEQYPHVNVKNLLDQKVQGHFEKRSDITTLKENTA